VQWVLRRGCDGFLIPPFDKKVPLAKRDWICCCRGRLSYTSIGDAIGIGGESHLSSAESARGISPRAAHRAGRESLDSSGSCHP
jgi:hypothetical protein